MNKVFISLIATALLAPSAVAVRPLALKSQGGEHTPQFKAPSGSLWRAASRRSFKWTDNGEWALSSASTTTYTPQGFTASRVEWDVDDSGNRYNYKRSTYEYGSDEYYSYIFEETSSDSVNWTPYVQITRTYDSRIPGCIVENNYTFWNGSAWQTTPESYRRTITRNADGFVESVVVSEYDDGEYRDTQRTLLTYGEDGLPFEALLESLTLDDSGNPTWQAESEYTNIVWERFDGQLYDIDDIPSPTNAPKSLNASLEDMPVTASFSYPDERGSYEMTGTGKMSGVNFKVTGRHTVLDDFGSYEDYGEMSMNVGFIPYRQGSRTRVVYDAYGLLLESYEDAFEGQETTVYADFRSTVVYDETTGCPSEYIVTALDPETGGQVNFLRVVYTDYVDPAGVTEITTSDAAPRYFNLSGTEIALPDTPGIYICLQGSKATKIHIR